MLKAQSTDGWGAGQQLREIKTPAASGFFILSPKDKFGLIKQVNITSNYPHKKV